MTEPFTPDPGRVWTVERDLPPDSITLGPHTWTIRTDHDTATYLRHDQSRGTTDVCTHTIRLDAEGLSPGALRETILHEALHACWHAAGLDADGHPADDHQEQVITALAPQLLHLLRANPGLVGYLTG